MVLCMCDANQVGYTYTIAAMRLQLGCMGIEILA
jgi:hypothetical protein